MMSPRRAARTLARLTFLGAASAWATVACDGTDSYVYTAQRFDPSEGCLGDYESVEVVAGSGASATCPAACFSFQGELYVSTVCPPLPAGAEAVEASEPECAAALAAASQEATCSAGGPVIEGGGDDAATDAASVADASADASPSADAAISDAQDDVE